MATKFFSQAGGGDGSDATHPMSAAQFNSGTGLANGDTAYILGPISTVLTTPKTNMTVRGDYAEGLKCGIDTASSGWTLFNGNKAATVFRGFDFDIPDTLNINGIYVSGVNDTEIFDCNIYASDQLAIYCLSGGVAYVHDCEFSAHPTFVNNPTVRFGVAGGRFEDCVMNCGAGVGFLAEAASTVKGNAFVGGLRKAVQLSSHNGSIVEANTFDDNGADVLYPAGVAAAVELVGSASANKILRNIIRNCYLGVHLNATSGTDENIVAFNYIYNSVVNAISQITDANTGFNHVYHNTIIHNPRQGNTPEYVGHAIAVQNTARKAKIANNLIVLRRANKNTHGLFIADDARTMNVWADYNVYIGVTDAALVQNDGTNLKTLAEIRASLQADAEFFGMDGGEESAESHGMVLTDTIADDGKLPNLSRAAHAGFVIAGINDAGQLDPWGNATPAAPNIGADQGAAKGFGPWSPTDSTMPALSLAAAAPGSLLEVQEWTRSDVTKKQIDKVSK